MEGKTCSRLATRSYLDSKSRTKRFTIKAILEDSVLDKDMPAWNQLVLAWAELHSLPQSWIAALKQWRGIYFIHDSADGRGYVGSACGDENIYGRWMNYAASGDGGNKLLRARKPQSFRFSVLQLVSQDMESEKVIAVRTAGKIGCTPENSV